MATAMANTRARARMTSLSSFAAQARRAGRSVDDKAPRCGASFKWQGADLNRRHPHFQCGALPTELPCPLAEAGFAKRQGAKQVVKIGGAAGRSFVRLRASRAGSASTVIVPSRSPRASPRAGNFCRHAPGPRDRGRPGGPHAPSLQGFLSWLREGTRVVKRDMEQGLDEVRVMTVHGAKGLEAPIVFLPDTCSTRSARPPGGLLKLDDGQANDAPAHFVWPVKGTGDLATLQQAKAASGAGRGGGTQPAALRGADACARPAVRGGLRGRQRAAGGLLVQSHPAGPRRPPRRDRGGRRTRRVAHRQRADRQARGRHGACAGFGRVRPVCRPGPGDPHRRSR